MRNISRTSKQEATEQIAVSLGLEDIPDDLWVKVFVEGGKIDHITAYLEDCKGKDFQEARENLKLATEAVKDFAVTKLSGVAITNPQPLLSENMLSEREDSFQSVTQGDLTDEEELWLTSLQAFSVSEAVLLPEFKQFRAKYLPNGPLNKDNIALFLKSPAHRLFSLEELNKWNINVTNHSCDIISQEVVASGKAIKFAVKFLPSGDIRYATHDVSARRTLNSHLDILEEKGNSRNWSSVWTYPNTVLDEVRRLSIRIAKKYDWDARQVIDLLLRGRLLRYPHIPVHLRGRCVTMKLPLMLSRETVGRVFRDFQKNYFEESDYHKNRASEKSLKQRIRPPSQRKLGVYHFVTAMIDLLGVEGEETPSQLHDIFNAWNERLKDDSELRYKSQGRFFEDYKRTKALLARLISK